MVAVIFEIKNQEKTKDVGSLFGGSNCLTTMLINKKSHPLG